MKYYIGLFIILLSANLSAQTTVKMSAVKANNYGVAYSLPKTTIEVTVKYSKTSRKAGEFYQYAERYLSISNPILEDGISYKIDEITANAKGVVDKDNSYLVEFRSGTTAPYVTLTKDGLICAINEDYVFQKIDDAEEEAITTNELPNPKSFLSEEILRAGSSVKQAELIAKQIYRLRESRTNILTGEADNMPPDGTAYKLVMEQLDTQEKALIGMFAGTEVTESGLVKKYVITLDDKNIDNRIVFRFSSKLGVVTADNLAGAPVYLSLINKNPIEKPILTAKEEKALAEKFAKGIIYNIPAKASLNITFNGKSLIQKDIDIVQYGTQEVLVNKMFENNKKPVKVLFYPELGAIKQIIE